MVVNQSSSKRCFLGQVQLNSVANHVYLAEILLVLPISVAQSEHAISTQNRIKSNLCVNLGSSTREDLILVSPEGFPLGEYNSMVSLGK